LPRLIEARSRPVGARAATVLAGGREAHPAAASNADAAPAATRRRRAEIGGMPEC